MHPTLTETRILHLGSDPSELALLLAELEADGLKLRIERLRTQAELLAALDRGHVAMIIADLPLPWPGAAASLAAVQRSHPELPVIFRSGAAGTRMVTEAGLPTARAVREALQLHRLQAQPSEQDRRELLEQVVRNHEAQLRLARRDFWDFDAAIRDITLTGAELLDVRRVSLWELDPVSQKLSCALVYDRDRGVHAQERELELGPSYLAALEDAMFIAASDAQHDPRTSDFSADYLKRLGITSLLDAPVRREGKIVGVVCHEHIGPARAWSILDQCTAASLANLVAHALEVRDRRRAEDRLREAEKFEVIGRLAGRVAHDFNNLLTIILGNAELGLTRLLPGAPEAAGLEQIGQAAGDAGALIRQLLSYARREPMSARRIDLVARIEEMRDMIQRLLGQDVRVRFQLCGGPLFVALDPTRLQQILLNLTANARDAMQSGGDFVLTLERSSATAAAQAAPVPQARLRVQDSGTGIDAQALPRIFEPFFTTKSAKVGTGLGLASVAEIVRQAGGTVSVSSRPGQGATFEILLPEALALGAAEADEAGSSRTPRGGSVPARASVLLVEAEPNVRRVLRLTLERAGSLVLEAASPIEALEHHARGQHFDWVLSDLVLPQMDGVRLIESLRDFLPGLPALLIADFGALAEQRLDALRSGGRTLLVVKPLAPSEMHQAISALSGAPAG